MEKDPKIRELSNKVLSESGILSDHRTGYLVDDDALQSFIILHTLLIVLRVQHTTYKLLTTGVGLDV